MEAIPVCILSNMTYLAFESREVTPEVLAVPTLAERWKAAANNNLIKAVGYGRYSAVLDSDLASMLLKELPNVACYCYDDGENTVRYGFPA